MNDDGAQLLSFLLQLIPFIVVVVIIPSCRSTLCKYLTIVEESFYTSCHLNFVNLFSCYLWLTSTITVLFTVMLYTMRDGAG